MLKNLKSYLLIFFITISIWIVIDFFFGRSLLNSIKYANNHGTVHPNFHHTFLPNVNKILYFAGQEYTFCTDSHGFRKSCNANKKKNKNFDIIFIGDSVTEGVGLDFEDTIVGLIENKFKNRKIANMAASSYSTMIYNNKLQYLIKNDYSFNEVVVLIDPSDIQDDSEVYKISGETVISKERRMDRYNIYIDKIKYLSKNIVPMTYEILLQIKKKITNKENNLGNKGRNVSKEIILKNEYDEEFENTINNTLSLLSKPSKNKFNIGTPCKVEKGGFVGLGIIKLKYRLWYYSFVILNKLGINNGNNDRFRFY